MARQGFRIMDCDLHCMEPADLWLRYLEPELCEQGPRPLASAPGLAAGFDVLGRAVPKDSDRAERSEDVAVRRRLEQERFQADPRELSFQDGTSPSKMLAAMDVEGVDVAIVFRTLAAHVIGLDDLPPSLAAAYCRAFDNWLGDYCQTDRERLLPTAQMAVHDVDLAVAEARRAVRDLGALGLVLPSNRVKGRPWYDRYYDPLWAVAEELDVPVTFHGINSAYQEHLGNRFVDNFALARAAGHPVELMLTAGEMLTGGVFERFPRLRAGYLEGNCGWVPYWLYALDERWKKFGNAERFGMRLLPSEYFRRQCYVAMDVDEALVVDVIAAIGDDNIVLSTDWPHDDSAYPRAIEEFLALDGLSDTSRRKILWDNCARLYNVRTAAPV